MKVVLLVTWLFGYGVQAPAPLQIQFDSLDLCNAAVVKITADVARLEQEHAADMEAAQKKQENAEMARMFAAMSGKRYAVSAVCLVTSTAP